MAIATHTVISVLYTLLQCNNRLKRYTTKTIVYRVYKDCNFGEYFVIISSPEKSGVIV